MTDYLSDPALEAFFAAREHEAYYYSIKSVDERRDFHDRLIPVLSRALGLITERIEPAITEILERSYERWGHTRLIPLNKSAREAGEAGRRKAFRSLNTVPKARAAELKGVELLGVSPEGLDLKTLKTAYRAAAVRHHPDLGGSTTAMTAINLAYERLDDVICGRATASPYTTRADDIAGAVLWHHQARTARAFLWSITRDLFEVALDDWALDEASQWLDQLTTRFLATSTDDSAKAPRASEIVEATLRRSQTIASSESNDLLSRPDDPDDKWLTYLIDPSLKLAKRFASCGNIPAAERVLAIADIGLRRAQARGLNYDYQVRLAREVIARGKNPRLVLHHARQLDNALRLGAIDERRHAANLKRITDLETDRLQREKLAATTVFLQSLPTDIGFLANEKLDRLVPRPGYGEIYIERLSPNQRTEYAFAFGDNPDLDLIERYAWVRVFSLLRSAIYYLEKVDVAALGSEAVLLAKLQPRCLEYAYRTSWILSTLATLDEKNARQLADELRGLPDINLTPRFLDRADDVCDRYSARHGSL